MPEAKQHDDSERSQLKPLRDEITFLKSKVLYLEKLMEIVGVDPEMIFKKKIFSHHPRH